MKEWTVIHTNDAVHYKKTVIKGKTYTEALVNFELAYPGEIACDIKEKEKKL